MSHHHMSHHPTPNHSTHAPFISANHSPAELTLKATLLGITLAILLAISNTFLALKIGVLTASSIPAAMLSMAILRLFKNHTILENNLVQTCASSGEAVAGGIVYTLPALIIIHAWHHFPYWQTALIAWTGGVLGVLLTIPIRKTLMQNPQLRFPEAQAISQVLITGHKQNIKIGHLGIAAVLGGLFELAQTGCKLFANSASLWISKGQVVLGFGCGFSATLLGAGYLTGYAVGFSILCGSLIAHILWLPIMAHLSSALGLHHATSAHSYAQQLLDHHIRYIGIGAMLTAGVLTLLYMLKPFAKSLYSILGSRNTMHQIKDSGQVLQTIRTDYDMPWRYIIVGCILCWAICNYYFVFILHQVSHNLHYSTAFTIILSCSILLFVALMGFVFSAICAYFSGLVGVTASPGSSIAIASVLLAAALVAVIGHSHLYNTALLAVEQHRLWMTLTIIMTSIVMGSACVANNNSQDLKVGYTVGATPWKQQCMLLLGVTIAALVVPYSMQLLFQSYGIAGVGGMSANLHNTLAAPPAAAMAAIAQSAFKNQLPTQDLWYGAITIVSLLLVKLCFRKNLAKLSLIGVAIGIYLPLASATALFLGGLIDFLVQHKNHKVSQQAPSQDSQQKLVSAQHRGILIACGLVAGAAITNVVLAIPFAILKHGWNISWINTLHLATTQWFAAIATLALSVYLYRKSICS